MIDIENKEVKSKKHKLIDFLIAIENCQLGQSFVVPCNIDGSYRVVLRCAKRWLGKEFISRKDEDGYRVGLVKDEK